MIPSRRKVAVVYLISKSILRAESIFAHKYFYKNLPCKHITIIYTDTNKNKKHVLFRSVKILQGSEKNLIKTTKE